MIPFKISMCCLGIGFFYVINLLVYISIYQYKFIRSYGIAFKQIIVSQFQEVLLLCCIFGYILQLCPRGHQYGWQAVNFTVVLAIFLLVKKKSCIPETSADNNTNTIYFFAPQKKFNLKKKIQRGKRCSNIFFCGPKF